MCPSMGDLLRPGSELASLHWQADTLTMNSSVPDSHLLNEFENKVTCVISNSCKRANNLCN